jgi:hypothetical protein
MSSHHDQMDYHNNCDWQPSQTHLISHSTNMNNYMSINLDEILPTIDLTQLSTDQPLALQQHQTQPHASSSFCAVPPIGAELDFNTAQLVAEVKAKLARTAVSHNQLGKLVDMSGSYVGRLLADVQPWETMNEARRNQYRKMHAWLIQNEPLQQHAAHVVIESHHSHEITQTANGLSYYNLGQQPVQVQLVQHPPPIVTHIDPRLDFDTEQLVENVKSELKRRGLTIMHFSKKMKLSREYLGKLIGHPEEWHTLSKKKKNSYRKMHVWLAQNAEYVPVVERRTKKEEMAEARLNRVSVTVDPNEVAKRIVPFLDANQINHYYFVNRKLNISKTYFDELVARPRAWSELNEGDRETYRRMHRWTMATAEDVHGLKQHIETYKTLRLSKAKRRGEHGLSSLTERNDLVSEIV